MLNINAVAGLAVALTLTAAPVGAQGAKAKKHLACECPVNGVIFVQDRTATGAIARNCVNVVAKSEDLMSGRKTIRQTQICD